MQTGCVATLTLSPRCCLKAPGAWICDTITSGSDKLLPITVLSDTEEWMSAGKILWLQLQYSVAVTQWLELLLKQQGMLESKGKSASSWEVMCKEPLTSVPRGGFPTLQVFKLLINSY